MEQLLDSGLWPPESRVNVKKQFASCSRLYLSAQSNSHNSSEKSRGADHSQRNEKSPGSYPPQGKKKEKKTLMICLSCSLWSKLNLSRASFRSIEIQSNDNRHCRAWSKNMIWGETDCNVSSCFWQPNLQLPKWAGGTCRQVINRANQSKCKADKQLQGSRPEDRQHTWAKLASGEGFIQIFIEGAGFKGDGRGGVGGWGGG